VQASAGVVAAGHPVTAEAAATILEAGGNAFDAAVAALLASCVAEPVLASLGGGGFLLAFPAGGEPVVYDFFAQTPRRRRPEPELDFYPILADFGSAQQEFHIGLGTVAAPGTVRGLFSIHRELCRLPVAAIAAPALQAASEGIRLNGFQHYISSIVAPILHTTPEALALHQSPNHPERLAATGELVRQPRMSDSLDALLREGEDLFYRGEMGQALVRACREGGGHLCMADLEHYKVHRRTPLNLALRDARLLTNPAPSQGGTLIAIAMQLLGDHGLAHAGFGSEHHLLLLARSMRLTQSLRSEAGLEADGTGLPDETLMRAYRQSLRKHPGSSRGTTQISVADASGNLASMTLSNGEGAGHLIPGTGIMLNNMLGEEDLNPRGFHRWPENRRIASMMAPSLLLGDDGSIVATGSGGSNRIRSAILQVLLNLTEFELPLEQAVNHPRIHFESGLLNLEPEQQPAVLQALEAEFPQQKLWDGHNLFFGGAHSVRRDAQGGLLGVGDPRRGGVSRSA
jgi:gamma-glutamyltranspeptidase/glutathione hydrolase